MRRGSGGTAGSGGGGRGVVGAEPRGLIRSGGYNAQRSAARAGPGLGGFARAEFCLEKQMLPLSVTFPPDLGGGSLLLFVFFPFPREAAAVTAPLPFPPPPPPASPHCAVGGGRPGGEKGSAGLSTAAPSVRPSVRPHVCPRSGP